MKRLAIITTHPIQYYAPLFRMLSQRRVVHVRVFYTWGEQAREKIFDPGFGTNRSWDIPLLDGYEYEFVRNDSAKPGSSHFKGIINPDLIERIKNYKADVLLVFGWAFNSHLKILRHFKGKIPVYFRGDSTLIDEPLGFSIKKIARRFFLKWVYTHVDKAFYVGTNNKEYYKAHGLREKQLVYAPHAIDNNRFDDSDGKYMQQANEWKRQLNIPENKLIVLYAGKLEPKKNPMFLIEAAMQIPQMHFIIVGNGVLENEVKTAAAKVDNISFLPFQNQSLMPVVYRLADIFTLPSQGPGETWGLAINEAMACSKVVIASNKCGGAIDLIDEGENGFVIESKENAFINAFLKLEKNDLLLKCGGSFSKKKIAFFSYDTIIEKIENEME